MPTSCKQLGVEVDVRVHRLNVHLIRIPGELVALRVVAAGVLDQRFLHEFENRPVVLRVDLDRKRFKPAVVPDLDRAEGRQVLPELAQTRSASRRSSEEVKVKSEEVDIVGKRGELGLYRLSLPI